METFTINQKDYNRSSYTAHILFITVDQRNGFNLDLKLPTLAGDMISSGSRELKHFAPRNRAKKCLCRKNKKLPKRPVVWSVVGPVFPLGVPAILSVQSKVSSPSLSSTLR
jgi:hypothetical protein